MYAWDNGLISSGKIKREQGSWGMMVVLFPKGSKGPEVIDKNICGTIPVEEGVVMPEALGSVGMSCGTTINMGNFSSARVDCWITLPCKEEDMEDAYQRCHDFVTGKVEQESQRLVEDRNG